MKIIMDAMVQEHSRIVRVLLIDFNVGNNSTDPVSEDRTHLRPLANGWTFFTKTTAAGTPAPMHISQALKYPDGTEWARDHDEEILKWNQERVLDWSCTPSVDVKHIRITMSYIYKRDRDGSVNGRKPRCYLRENRMKSGRKYDPESVQCPTEEKAMGRLLISICTANASPMEQLDITNAYVHEPSLYQKPLYMSTISRIYGTFPHESKIEILKRSL